MSEQILSITDLVFDEALYPRVKVNWQDTYHYSQAMKAGAIFPPITVGVLEEVYYVVDGWHRVSAVKLLKQSHITARVTPYQSKRDLYRDAVKANVGHGRKFSLDEYTRIIDTLQHLDFTLEDIQSITFIPVKNIKRLQQRIFRGPNGDTIYAKSLIAKQKPTEDVVKGIDMSSFSVGDISLLLRQTVEIMSSQVFPWEDKNVLAQCQLIRQLFEVHL